ncbi:MAG: HAMP domain-containing protein [Rhodothermales bacterium]|nr:HAMP domain-containing protein [Rhodothermales bacterium]
MRIASWYAVSILILLTGFAGVTYVAFQRSLEGDFDQHLLHELNVLLPLVEFGAEGPEFRRFEAMRTVAYQTDGVFGTYVRLLSPEGDVLYASPNHQGHDPLLLALPATHVESVASKDWQGSPVRSHYHPLFDQGEFVGWLEVAGFEWSLDQELRRLAGTFAIGILVSVLLAMGGGYLLARRSLRPVSQITAVANRLHASELDTRVPRDPDVQDELTHLADTINALLDRIQASFHRERRFSANAAHELVTPLAAMRGEVELALRGSEVSPDLATRLQTVLEDIDRMTAIVRSLLQLSSVERLEASDLAREDVSELVGAHLARFSDRAAVEGREILSDLEPGAFAPVAADKFGRVVDVLLDNALKYSGPGDPITVSVSRKGNRVRLEVADQGIGFGPEEAAHLFDRFYRANSAAVQALPGSGLGLAIALAVVEAHGGVAEAHSAGPDQGALFRAEIPAA